jgi:hypothetical protein
MSAKRLLILPILLLSVTTVGFAGLINPISASVDLSMSSDAGCGAISNTSTQAWGTPLTELTASAEADAICTHPNRTVDTTGTVEADWNNARSGNVKFKDVGWKTNKNVLAGASNPNLGTDFSYTFSPTKNVDFSVAYSIDFRGDLNGFGLNGFYVSLDNSVDFLPIETSGSLSWLLLAGDTYTLTIENGANIQGSIPSLSEHMNGTFKFSTKAAAPTPEPSTLLMLGSGVLTMAASLRKKLSK